MTTDNLKPKALASFESSNLATIPRFFFCINLHFLGKNVLIIYIMKTLQFFIRVFLIILPVAFIAYFMYTDSKLNELEDDEKDLPSIEIKLDRSLSDMYPTKAHPRDYKFIRKYIGTTFDPTGKLYNKVKESVNEERTKYGIIVIIILCIGVPINLLLSTLHKKGQLNAKL